MWREGLLYRIPAEIIVSALCVLMILAAGIGYRVALRHKRGSPLEPISEVGPVEDAVAGVLALVLAFSFDMAEQRFDTRQTLVVSHTNAVESAFLRCSVLDPDDRVYCEDQLRTYVDLSVAYGAAPHDEKTIDAFERQTDAIEFALWTRVSAAARERPTPANVALLTAINDVIDRRNDREASIRIVVPPEVTIVVLFLCVIWGGLAGYSYGMKGNRRRAAWVVFSVLIALVVYVTLDFDRPRRGLLRLEAGNQSMIELQEKLRSRWPEGVRRQ
jgi:hypothetical protein